MRKHTLLVLFTSLAAVQTANAAEVLVKMADRQYAPTNLTVSVGDTIRFVNEDEMNHVVFIPTAKFATDLGKQEPGSEKTLPLAMAGSFEVECALHANMLVKVEVK